MRRHLQVIADSLDPRPYSSREFIREMGAYLEKQGKTPEKGGVDSIIFSAYQMDVPIFVPAFSDCSAGFGLVAHQHGRGDKPKVSIDSVKDFYELTQLKIANPTTGLLMIGGGVPKNFAQDIVVAAEILGLDAPMHKYAIQITVADVRDGALSSSTLKEASSWGKVDTTFEQMVYSEATLALPLITGYAYHKKAHAQAQATPLVAPVGAGDRVTDSINANSRASISALVLKWQPNPFFFYSFAPSMGILRGIPQWRSIECLGVLSCLCFWVLPGLLMQCFPGILVSWPYVGPVR